MTRVLPFFLPQFHPTPENDSWWGRGFTEWTLVTGARPAFRGHEQPKVPGLLGAYDLRDPEVRAAQAELARAHGIAGFAWYHYWTDGFRILHEPIDAMLADRSATFPFLFVWANHHWNRAWDGRPDQVLLEQRYSVDDDLTHIRWLCEHVLSDDRCIRVGGAPALAIWSAAALPDAARTVATWRGEADRLGVGPIHLIRLEQSSLDQVDPRPAGFDAGAEFCPHQGMRMPTSTPIGPRLRRALRLPGGPAEGPHLHRYEDLVTAALRTPMPAWPRYRCVAPGFDNSPRRASGARVCVGGTPAQYAAWVDAALATSKPPVLDDDILFVNAWNEWGEGAHLEPDARWGTAFLEVHRRAASSLIQ